MKLIIRLAGMLGLVATLGFATTWSGSLVDAKCYAAMVGNTRSSMSYVDRDTSWEIGYCAPRFKTKSFELVPVSGASFPLDSHGNAQASAIVRKIGKKRLIVVQVAGIRKGKKDVAVSTVKVVRVLPRPY
jgi:hypothetical protein